MTSSDDDGPSLTAAYVLVGLVVVFGAYLGFISVRRHRRSA